VRHRKTPIAHRVKPHIREGKRVSGYKRGNGASAKIYKPSRVVKAPGFRLGGNMTRVLRVLNEADRSLSQTDIILGAEEIQPYKNIDKNTQKLASSIEGKKVGSKVIPWSFRLTMAKWGASDPTAKDNPTFKDGQERMDQQLRGKAAADNLYANYSRCLRLLHKHGLIESTHKVEDRTYLTEKEASGYYPGDVKEERIFKGVLPNYRYVSSKGSKPGTGVGYKITDKGRRLLKASS